MKYTPNIEAVVAELRKRRKSARRFANRTQNDEDSHYAFGRAMGLLDAIDLLTTKPKP